MEAALAELTPEEYARRQAIAARMIAARIADRAERVEILAMLGLPAATLVLAA